MNDLYGIFKYCKDKVELILLVRPTVLYDEKHILSAIESTAIKGVCNFKLLNLGQKHFYYNDGDKDFPTVSLLVKVDKKTGEPISLVCTDYSFKNLYVVKSLIEKEIEEFEKSEFKYEVVSYPGKWNRN